MMGASACTDGATRVETTEALTSALARSGPGDVVEVGDVTLEGSFVVPSGVTLRGSAAGSRIAAPEAGLVAVELTAGTRDEPTVVSDLTVESAGAAAIAIPAGSTGSHARLERLLVGVGLGVGIAAESIDLLEVEDVTVAGSIDAESVASLPLDPTPAEAPTHGFVAIRVAHVAIQNLDVSGFARFGVLLLESAVEWAGGETRMSSGTCLMSMDGDLTLRAVSASEALESDSVFPSYGVVLAGSGVSTVTDLSLVNNQGVAALVTQSESSLIDTVVTGNRTGVWAQGVSGFHMSGAGTRIEDNDFAGIVLRDSTGTTLEDVTVRGTRLVERAVGSTSVPMGDGLQLVGNAEVAVTGSTFENNGRVGLLVDLEGGSTSDITFSAVDVRASDTALGAIVQNGTIEAGWDEGVTRDSVASANDDAQLSLGQPLEVVGIILPLDIPIPDDLRVGGLTALGVGEP